MKKSEICIRLVISLILQSFLSKPAFAQNTEKYNQYIPYTNNIIQVRVNDSWGIVDSSDNVIIPIKYHLQVQPISDTLFITTKYIGDKLFYGIINISEKTYLPFVYEDIHSYTDISNFPNETVYLRVEKKYGQSGVMDINLKELIPLRYSYVDMEVEGFNIFCYTDTSLDIYNSNHQMIYTNKNDKLTSIITASQGKFALLTNGNTYKLVSTEIGNILIENIDRRNPVFIKELDLILFSKNGKFGLVNKQGILMVKPLYKSISIFPKHIELEYDASNRLEVIKLDLKLNCISNCDKY